jgi:hypothetical protein
MSAPPPPVGGPDLPWLYQMLRDMDAKLDRLVETFVTVREYSQLETRVANLESRWRQNIAWVVGLIGAVASVGYLIVYLTK